MSNQNIPDDRHTEPNAEILGTEHRFKDLCQHIITHSGAIILNINFTSPIGNPGIDCQLLVGLINLIKSLQRICKDINNHTAQTLDIDWHLATRLQIFLEFNVFGEIEFRQQV